MYKVKIKGLPKELTLTFPGTDEPPITATLPQWEISAWVELKGKRGKAIITIGENGEEGMVRFISEDATYYD